MFSSYIAQEMERVKACPEAELLSELAFSRFADMLQGVSDWITGSSHRHFLSQEAAAWNPLASSIPEILTTEERERAEKSLIEKVKSGELVLPKPLLNALSLQLGNVTTAFLEMLCRLSKDRREICATLKFGRGYEKILDLELSSGDRHNHGRSVALVTTDAGKLLYKPRDMRWDRYIYDFAERFFPGTLGIARCIAFQDRYGVCEYIGKERLEGEGNARAFWHKMGGVTAFIKLMGSTDMHCENITCAQGKPYLLDLETILSPIPKEASGQERNPGIFEIANRSISRSCLPPKRLGKYEGSVLFNRGEIGCAPVVDGVCSIVTDYLEDFIEGFCASYGQILRCRAEIQAFLEGIDKDIPVRLILRNTRGYLEMMKKLCHYTAFSDPDGKRAAEKLLQKLLSMAAMDRYKEAVPSELEQMFRGDVPYIYTLSGGYALYSDGKMAAEGFFAKSPLDHALENLEGMCDADRAFDMAYIRRMFTQYPAMLPKARKDHRPVRAEEALPPETARKEAGRILEQLYALRLRARDGHSYWGYNGTDGYSFCFCDASLANGLGGMAVFAAAYAAAAGDAHFQEIHKKILAETLHEFRLVGSYFEKKFDDANFRPEIGEYDGLGSSLLALALLRRYLKEGKEGQGGIEEKEEIEEIKGLQRELLHRIRRLRLRWISTPDRIAGAAGLLSALCRFPEYRGEAGSIRVLADWIIGQQDLSFGGIKCWKTIAEIDRPLNGAGHGMAGIAEALLAAAKATGDEKYLPYAEDALRFEKRLYEKYYEKFGTWADLRTYPPDGYMNGYCAGAPGIGIMLSHIKETGIYPGEEVDSLMRYARKSTDKLPLNIKDHLCCGNAAIVEYYLTIGDRQAAGKVLGGMYARKEKEGEYRYTLYEAHNSLTPSLLYGVSGVGYEMLRYAFPEKVMGIF